jgi:hypothetical protein
VELPPSEIHVVPFERHQLTDPKSREQQRQHDHVAVGLDLGRLEGIQESAQLFRLEEDQGHRPRVGFSSSAAGFRVRYFHFTAILKRRLSTVHEVRTCEGARPASTHSARRRSSRSTPIRSSGSSPSAGMKSWLTLEL